MLEDLEKVKDSILIKGIKTQELSSMLGCLRGVIKKYNKGETVISEGQKLEKFGILIEGNLQIVQYDYIGNKSVISVIQPKQIFGEAFAYVNKVSSFNVEAIENSQVLFLDSNKLSTPCENCCTFHKQLVKNLLFIISNKNVNLTQKIECMSKRTTKEKLLTFLSLESIKNKSKEFYIQYDRQSLADYLGVERSAMSTELSKLRKDGIIEFEKNWFKLL
ncbi:Crp/Fnr family transcriptional regulator [bacterium]|nr:Crp/Fnr family transcriptional regulator [bacterium]